MPLTLVLGPANSAKAGEVLAAYADAAHRGALLVVPTRVDAEYYARELAGEGAVLGSVLTFAGLAREIARRAEYAGGRLSALQRDLVVRRAVRGGSLELLARSAGAPGFAEAATNLIADLGRSLISPQRFARALDAWAAEDERRRPYARDLTALYRAYDRELERLGRVDAERFAWRALDALRAAPGRWGTEPVFVYGFDDLTPLERDAVETLARVVGTGVTVSLTYEPGRAALSARAETVEELRPLADRVLELPALDEHYLPQSRRALHHLERRLFDWDPAHPSERIDPGPAVRLLEAGGERAEVELVAAEVLALLRDGIPGEETAVVFRSAARAAPVVEQVFAQYGIPLSGQRRIRFAHTALGRSVVALARCALAGPDRAGAQDLLDYLRAPGAIERPELADALEAELRREGITTADGARERLGWRLAEIDTLRDADDPAAELARAARRLFAAPHRGTAPELNAAEELDARALGALLRALEEVTQLGVTVGREELLDLLDDLDVPAGAPVRPGAVLLADPLEIRARRFRAVFVCGLQEGEFPLAGLPEPFLSDDRRRELARSAGLRLRPSEDALARERYLFYACVSRATERLVLSYRSSDEEGNLALPSPFVADVAELLDEEWAGHRRRRLLSDVVWDEEAAPTAREQARARAAAAGAARSAGAPEAPVFSLGEVALAHVRHRELVSGGALEAYAECPVRWLVERELQPELFGPEPEPLGRGSYMHSVLEELIRRLGAPVTAGTLPDAYRILDEVIVELPPPGAAGASEGARAAALRSIEADLRRYLRHEARDGCELAPDGLELRFGFEHEEGSLPALELDGGVRVRGVIDRVDVDGAGHAIVRDYKSGGVRPAYQGARWACDRQLQVAVYMLAVRRLLGLEPVAGLYQPLGGGDLRARGAFLKGAPVGACLLANDAREQEALDEMLQDAEARAVALAARLRTGELEPCPQTCSREGCKYPGICRVS